MKVVCSSCAHDRANHSPGYDYTKGEWRTVCRVVGCACVTWQPSVASNAYAAAIRNQSAGGR